MPRSMLRKGACVVALTMLIGDRNASAQTLHDVLTFLLINRSVATDDFVRDQQSAQDTGAAIADFLLIDLSTVPISTSASGFTYRLDPSLGTNIRSTDTFDPFFTERALTAGSRRITFGLSYQQSSFQTIDGRSLRDGTLVSTASRLHGDGQFFDVETLTLRVHSDTALIVGNVGLTDRLDIESAMPLLRLTVSGQRVDTYRGHQTLQASGTATTTGPGDLIVRGKYQLVRRANQGFAVGAEARLPTGDDQNLLGAGHPSGGPRLIGSVGTERASAHANVAYNIGGLSNDLTYSAAVTIAATNRLTLVGEMRGDRLSSVGRLVETAVAHPTLLNVETVRLTTSDEPTKRLLAVAGLKWNFRSTWLVTANVIRPLTDTGLNARWTPTVTLNHSFGQ